jgi:hypothetical protein
LGCCARFTTLTGRADCDGALDHLRGKLKPEVKPTMAHDKRTATAAPRAMYALILFFIFMCFFLSSLFFEICGPKFVKKFRNSHYN